MKASLFGRVMPPADENTWWFVSTAMMSLYLVTDQWAAKLLSGVQCTGSSRRSRSKIGHMASAWLLARRREAEGVAVGHGLRLRSVRHCWEKVTPVSTFNPVSRSCSCFTARAAGP